MDASIRSQKLNAVFLKAIDSATDSISPAEIRECFGSGNNAVENLFVNSIAKMKSAIEVIFLCFISNFLYFR